MYVDQFPKGDMSRDLAKKHGVPIVRTIDEAITLGTDKVQVAGVLSIGEHGDYPYTEDTHQHMYPRRRFFDESVAALRRGGKVVPVFNDKHLSYNWRDAKHMYDTARKLKIPFMAGSSLPVTRREPPLAPAMGCEMQEAFVLSVGRESYGIHTLETLQCMVERRRGGETGVKSVQAVQGEEIWKARDQGRWSNELFHQCLIASGGVPDGRIEDKLNDTAAAWLIEYRDGFRATVAMFNGLNRYTPIAIKVRGKDRPLVTDFKLQYEKPWGHFAYQLKAIEEMIHTGRPSYPVERTLLTTGVLDAAIHSLVQNNKRLATPQLDVRYKAVDWPFANADGSPELVKWGKAS